MSDLDNYLHNELTVPEFARRTRELFKSLGAEVPLELRAEALLAQEEEIQNQIATDLTQNFTHLEQKRKEVEAEIDLVKIRQRAEAITLDALARRAFESRRKLLLLGGNDG